MLPGVMLRAIMAGGYTETIIGDGRLDRLTFVLYMHLR